MLNQKYKEKYREKLETAKKEAIQQGLQQGLQQGIEKGQKNKSLEIAKKMLENKTDIELIKEFTGLSEEEINNLK